MQTSLDSSTRVLVLHTEEIVCFGLAAALGAQPGVEVRVGALPVAAHLVSDFDIVVCDYDTGLLLAQAVRQQGSRLGKTRLLVITAQDREQAVRLALEGGVHGYMLQGCPVEQLLTGVQALARGQRFLSLGAAQRMADSITREALTSREAEVLRLLAFGRSNKSIARDLRIAEGTVKSHVKAILGKLGASSRTHAVAVAAQRGLVAMRVADAAIAPRGLMNTAAFGC